jgi:hypothetical protein
MNILERARASREAIKINSAGRTRSYKFKVGKTLISLLPLHADIAKPAAERAFEREYGQHYLKNKKGEFIVAVGDRSLTFGEQCPVRDGLVDMIRYGNEIGDDELAELAKNSLARKNILFGVYVHKDTEGKEDGAQLASVSESLFDQFLAIIDEYAAEDLDSILRWDDRLTFIVEREGTTMTDTKYKIYPAAKRQSVNASVMDKAVNIEEYVRAQFTDSVGKALNYIASQTGRSLAGSSLHTALTAPPGSPVVDAPFKVVEPEGDDDDSLLAAAPPRTASAPALAASREVDAEFDEMAPAPAPAPASVSDDDLLAEIDKLAA